MIAAAPTMQAWSGELRHWWRASPWPGFLHWWLGELRPLLPARWRGWLQRGVDWYLLAPVGAGWTLRRPGGGEPLLSWDAKADARAQVATLHRALNAVERDDLRLCLLLPNSAVLRRRLSLPLAARSDLAQVLAFEMDRQTPFTAAHVYYAAHEVDEPAPAGHCLVDLVAVPRAVLDAQLAHLASQGLAVDAVDVASGETRFGVDLLPRERRPRHPRPRQRLNLLLAAACMLLLVFGLGQWLHNQRLALAQMQATVAGMQHDAQQVVALRQQLRDDANAAVFLARRKHDAVTMLDVLEDLTTRLPDTAWLERFSVDSAGQVGLQGQSPQAARLLDALSGSPVIANASFQGGIQPEAATGKERFYLVAHLREPAAAAAPTAAGAKIATAGSAP